ncbi:MAG: FecR family protein [Mangrovibacterium sp.]
MKRGKFTEYSIEDLLEDPEFISAVKRAKTEGEWDQFLRQHDGTKGNMLQARKFIRLMQTNEETLPEKEMLWEAIRKTDRQYTRVAKGRKIRLSVSIAASVIILITIGSLLIPRLKSERPYEFSEIGNEENSMLILPGGEKVALKKRESELVVLNDQEAIQIDRDSVVKTIVPATKVAMNEMIIPFGKKSKLSLADGTIVWLNAGSHFAFPQKFVGAKREVFLDGEAYFEVVKNKDQPFIVHSNDFQVEVLGTKFSVCGYASDNYSEALLLEGSVNIRVNRKLFNDELLLSPNQKAIWSKEREEISLHNELSPELSIAWIKGWYEFSDEDIEHVLIKIERYYNVTVQYDRAFISRALKVSGKLDLKESIGDVMKVIAEVAKIDYQITGDRLIVIK